MSSSAYKSPQYQALRRELLSSHPDCYHCGQPATTIDHLVEVDRQGEHTRDNCVPSCRPCNSRRGAQYGNAKRAAVTKARNAAVTAQHGTQRAPSKTPKPSRPKATKRSELEDDLATTSGFLVADGHPEPPGKKISPKRARSKAKPATDSDGTDAGEILPRLETSIDRTHTYGPLASAWGERVLGVKLYRWQQRVLDGILAHDGAGKLLARSSLTSVARQNGKTTFAKVLLGFWLCEMPKIRGERQTIISVAHQLDLAVALFQELAPVLEEATGAKGKWSYGRNELEMPDGSKWLVRAATASAGHGRSPDLVFADEIWDIGEEAIEQGLIPSQRARRSPHIAMVSTAGTEASRLMLRWRERGIQAIEDGDAGGFYFCEYSPPPGVDLSDPIAGCWTMGNPAIGESGLTLETLIEESRAPNRSSFLRSSLNLWIAADAGWLEPGVWERLLYEGDPLPPASVLAVDSSVDGDRYVGVLAHPYGADGCVLDVAFVCTTESEMWQAIERTLPARATFAVTPGLEIHTPKVLEARKVIVGYGELVRWTGMAKGMIGDGKILHTGSQHLADHIGRAVVVKTQAGVVMSSQKSAGPIELARCAIWASALATKSKWKGRPQIVTGRR